MSDFLTNLAARAIAQPTLRPRMRSRFEPAPEVAAAPPIEIAPTATAKRTTTAAMPVMTTPKFRSAVAVATALDPPPETQSGGPAAALLNVATPEEIVRVEREVEIHHEQREPEVRRVVETDERVVPVRQIEHRFEKQPPRIIREVEREELHRERVEQVTVNRRQQPIVQQIETREEKTVHVSIGRIEVRALPQAQPQREEVRHERMTIDDYVARRKAKERR